MKYLARNGILRFELDILAIHVGLRIAALPMLHRSRETPHRLRFCSNAKNTSAEECNTDDYQQKLISSVVNHEGL